MAILETNGELSVLKKTSQQPITPEILRMVLKQEGAPTLLILDGEILHKNLSTLNITKDWLEKEVKKHGAKDIDDVFIAQVDAKGQLFVDLYDGNDN